MALPNILQFLAPALNGSGPLLPSQHQDLTALAGKKAPKPSKLDKLIDGLNSALSSPSDAPLLGFGQGLLAASAPHMLTPVTMGQALGMGLQGSQAYQHAMLANAMQRAVLPMAQAKTQAIVQALHNPTSYAGHTFADNVLGGQAAVSHDPRVVAAATQAAQAYTPHNVGPGQRMVTGMGAPVVGAQGALPTGTAQTPTGGLQMMPGALPALARTAYATGAGSSQGALPAREAEKLTGFQTVTPSSWKTQTGGGAALNPAVAAYLNTRAGRNTRTQAMQKETGIMSGISGTSGAPPPGIAPQQQAQQMEQAQAQQAQAQQEQQAQGQPPQGAPPQQGMPHAPPQAMPQPQQAPVNPLGTPMSFAQYKWMPEAQKAAVETYKQFQQQANDALQLKTQIANLGLTTQAFQPGQFADTRAKVLNYLQSTGMISPSLEKSLGSAQEGSKLSIQMQSVFTRALGNREAAQVFATMGHAVPNLTLSPDGISKISAFMDGIARYNQARYQSAQTYFNGGNYKGINKVTSQYLTNTNPMYYILASAPAPIRQEMIQDMVKEKGKAATTRFLMKWQQATKTLSPSGQPWAPTPSAYENSP